MMAAKDFEFDSKHELVMELIDSTWADHAGFILEQLKLSAERHIPAEVMTRVKYVFEYYPDVRRWIAKWIYTPPSK